MSNPLDEIVSRVSSSVTFELYQPRDWPHRRGDRIDFTLHGFPLAANSPGMRRHPCELCGKDNALCIHDNVLCWKCKGAFCLQCYTNPGSLMTLGRDKLLKDGFANCKVCEEPLRSIGLIDIFRKMIDDMKHQGEVQHLGGGVMACGKAPNDRPNHMVFSCNSSLLQEAEEAVVRAEKHAKKKRTQAAIDEFTHALNAVNYLTSTSNGTQLVFTAKDLFLFCHMRRAELEGNNDLASAILDACPKCSVKNKKKGEELFSLSKTGFSSLFYPLPAKYYAGSNHAAFIVRDQRHDSKQNALQGKFFRQQIEILRNSGFDIDTCMDLGAPHLDGTDGAFDNRNGTWKGVYTHEKVNGNPMLDVTIGEKTFRPLSMIQFIWAFETEREANDYRRNRIATGTIGEENDPLQSKHSPQLSKAIKKRSKQLGVKVLNSTYVISSTIDLNSPKQMTCVSVMAVVGNIVTKIFVSFLLGSPNIDGVELAARALVYLDHWLLVNRCEKGSPLGLKGIVYHTPDLTLCAYCGTSGCTKLKLCTRCRKSKYCSVACQRAHFQDHGPFGHRKFCNKVAKS